MMRFQPLHACRSWVRFAMACYDRGLLTTDVLERLMPQQLTAWEEIPRRPPDASGEPCTCQPGTVGWARHPGTRPGTLSPAFCQAIERLAEEEP